MHEGVHYVSEAEQREQNEHVNVLQSVVLLESLQRVQTKQRIADDIRVPIGMIGIDMVLHDMLCEWENESD